MSHVLIPDPCLEASKKLPLLKYSIILGLLLRVLRPHCHKSNQNINLLQVLGRDIEFEVNTDVNTDVDVHLNVNELARTDGIVRILLITFLVVLIRSRQVRRDCD